jgi:hypothetical protein
MGPPAADNAVEAKSLLARDDLETVTAVSPTLEIDPLRQQVALNTAHV